MPADMITGRTRGGEEWVPSFISALDQSTCIGCGRCYKVCPRDVFELVSRGDVMDDDDFDDDDDDDDEMMVMSIADLEDCIGCMACSKVCPKNCQTHESVAA